MATYCQHGARPGANCFACQPARYCEHGATLSLDGIARDCYLCDRKRGLRPETRQERVERAADWMDAHR